MHEQVVNICPDCGRKHNPGECDGRPNLSGYPVEFEASGQVVKIEAKEPEEPGYGHGV